MVGRSNDIDLSIAIPAYNEAEVITETVEQLVEALSPTGWSFEIVIADDNSRDATWRVLEELAGRHRELRPVRNRGANGYGMAVRAAIAATVGEAVIVAMADGSDPPEDIVAYGQAMLDEGYDCAFGTRFTDPRRVSRYPLFKRLLNRAGNRLIRLTTGYTYDDFTNGFKGYRRSVLDAMGPLICSDFNLTVEMSMKAVMIGARIKIVTTGWRERDAGVSKFDIRKLGPKYLLTVLYCALHARLAQTLPRGGAPKNTA